MKSYQITDQIQSETLGKGPLCMTLHFEADVCRAGPDGVIVCWDEEGHSYDFWGLPLDDREKIIEQCKKHFEGLVANELGL